MIKGREALEGGSFFSPGDGGLGIPLGGETNAAERSYNSIVRGTVIQSDRARGLQNDVKIHKGQDVLKHFDIEQGVEKVRGGESMQSALSQNVLVVPEAIPYDEFVTNDEIAVIMVTPDKYMR